MIEDSKTIHIHHEAYATPTMKLMRMRLGERIH